MAAWARVASESDDCTVMVLEARSGRLVRTLAGHTSWVSALASLPGGLLLASGADDSTVRVWEVESMVESGRLVRTLAGHTDYVRAAGGLLSGVTCRTVSGVAGPGR